MRVAKLLYIFMWSLGLLVATYPCLLSFDLPFDFSHSVMIPSHESMVKSYYFSLMMVMELFLFDVIYTFALEYSSSKKKVNNFLEVLILLSVFFLLFALSLYCSNVWILGVCFFGSWIVLTIMKSMKTEAPQDSRTSEEGIKINRQ